MNKINPKALHAGIKRGTITKIIVVASKKHPKTKIKIFINRRNNKG